MGDETALNTCCSRRAAERLRYAELPLRITGREILLSSSCSASRLRPVLESEAYGFLSPRGSRWFPGPLAIC